MSWFDPPLRDTMALLGLSDMVTVPLPFKVAVPVTKRSVPPPVDKTWIVPVLLTVPSRAAPPPLRILKFPALVRLFRMGFAPPPKVSMTPVPDVVRTPPVMVTAKRPTVEPLSAGSCHRYCCSWSGIRSQETAFRHCWPASSRYSSFLPHYSAEW